MCQVLSCLKAFGIYLSALLFHLTLNFLVLLLCLLVSQCPLLWGISPSCPTSSGQLSVLQVLIPCRHSVVVGLDLGWVSRVTCSTYKKSVRWSLKLSSLKSAMVCVGKSPGATNSACWVLFHFSRVLVYQHTIAYYSVKTIFFFLLTFLTLSPLPCH